MGCRLLLGLGVPTGHRLIFMVTQMITGNSVLHFGLKKIIITENCFFLVFCRPTEGREILYMAAVNTKASSDPSVLLCQSGDIFEAQTARLGNAGNSGLG